MDINYLRDITWKCQICGKERPDKNISVHTTNLTIALELSDMGDNVVELNTKYCNDNEDCFKGAVQYNKEYKKRFSS